ncbi:nucleoporin GLE1-like [Acropora millepora]|uniref:nucleoporin GLE1-like n=1 Tax=Acropora millepora TaxID=45264 RepID=UPI001CF2DE57|nr:nucleoporin GLE1-like [Acropora millepora]
MEWAQDHDLVLCRELLVINPFQAKYKTTARAKLWDQAVEDLAKTTRPAFKKSLDKRAVQERYRLLTEKFKKRMAKERIESGINPTMSELDVLVEELVEREQTEKHHRENDDKSNSKKKEDGEEMRQKALEKLGETSKRKSEKEGEDGKPKKTRKSSSDTIEYLREKRQQEMKLKEKHLELEKSQQEEEKRKNDAFFNVMLQQQQQQQQQQLMMMLSQQSQVMIKMLEKMGK